MIPPCIKSSIFGGCRHLLRVGQTGSLSRKWTRLEGAQFPADDHPLADDPAVERYAETTSWTLRQLGTSVERPDWYEDAMAATDGEE